MGEPGADRAQLREGGVGRGGLAVAAGGAGGDRGVHDLARGEDAGAVDVLGEGGDVVVLRPQQDVLGGADLDDAAVAHDGDAVAQAHGLVQVVGDEDDRLLELLLEFQQLVLHVTADQRVQGAEGLVHQQQVGVGGERAGEADALLHAAGQLVGPGLLPAGQAAQGERLVGAACALGAGHALHFQTVGGVLAHAAVREEREVLEHHADLLGADLAQFAGAERGQVLAVEAHMPGGRLEQAVQHAQQGGLAGTGQAHDDEDLAGLHGEGRVDHGSGGALGAQVVPVRSVPEPLDRPVRSSAEHLVQALCFKPR